jgi:hypothetical protein
MTMGTTKVNDKVVLKPIKRRFTVEKRVDTCHCHRQFEKIGVHLNCVLIGKKWLTNVLQLPHNICETFGSLSISGSRSGAVLEPIDLLMPWQLLENFLAVFLLCQKLS